MGVWERKVREKNQRRESILNAAESLFIDSGMDEVTMEQVAELAEIAKGTLYLYFKNKEELIAAITLKAVEIFDQLLQTNLNSFNSARDQLICFIRTYIEFFNNHEHYFNLFILWDNIRVDWDEMKNRPESSIFQLMEKKAKINAELSKIVYNGIKSGEFVKTDNPDKLIFIIFSTLYGVLSAYYKAKQFKYGHIPYGIDEIINEYILYLDKMMMTSH